MKQTISDMKAIRDNLRAEVLKLLVLVSLNNLRVKTHDLLSTLQVVTL